GGGGARSSGFFFGMAMAPLSPLGPPESGVVCCCFCWFCALDCAPTCAGPLTSTASAKDAGKAAASQVRVRTDILGNLNMATSSLTSIRDSRRYECNPLVGTRLPALLLPVQLQAAGCTLIDVSSRLKETILRLSVLALVLGLSALAATPVGGSAQSP